MPLMCVCVRARAPRVNGAVSRVLIDDEASHADFKHVLRRAASLSGPHPIATHWATAPTLSPPAATPYCHYPKYPVAAGEPAGPRARRARIRVRIGCDGTDCPASSGPSRAQPTGQPVTGMRFAACAYAALASAGVVCRPAAAHRRLGAPSQCASRLFETGPMIGMEDTYNRVEGCTNNRNHGQVGLRALVLNLGAWVQLPSSRCGLIVVSIVCCNDRAVGCML
jgi:hypothetical protein